MKKIKGGNLVKLVAFFVIAAVLTCTASFAANGWQSFVNNEPVFLLQIISSVAKVLLAMRMYLLLQMT